jgi:hypothetical protein
MKEKETMKEKKKHYKNSERAKDTDWQNQSRENHNQCIPMDKEKRLEVMKKHLHFHSAKNSLEETKKKTSYYCISRE